MRTLTLKVASGLLYLGGGIRLPSERRKDSPLVGGHPNICTVAQFDERQQTLLSPEALPIHQDILFHEERGVLSYVQ